MKHLVIAEHNNEQLASATLHAVQAASELSGQVDVLVAGQSCRQVAEQAAALEHVGQVLLVEAEHYADQMAENLSVLVCNLIKEKSYNSLVAASTCFGRNVTPRIAALLDVAQVSDVTRIHKFGHYDRPIYAGNVILTLESEEAVQVLTARTTAFDSVALCGQAEIVALPPAEDLQLAEFDSRELTVSARPDLASASVVVSGGRGLASAENFQAVLAPLADQLGAALGASRAAVDAGFVPNDFQVGQTGKIVAPELYVAVGISGAIQHLAGMSDSKVIVAINKDAEAPIFQVADYCLEADLFDAVPAFKEGLA